MFAIYTPSGLMFRGPLERLRRVEEASGTASARRVDHPQPEFHSALEEGVEGYKVSQQAAEKYRSQLASEGQRERVYHAYQVMSSSVQVVQSDWTVMQALQCFRQFRYQVLPVVDKQRQLVGSLSRRQLYEFVVEFELEKQRLETSVGESFLVGDSRVYTADPVTDIRRITALLLEKNLDAVPVVEEGGTIVGIVSRSDILRCASSDPPLSLWC